MTEKDDQTINEITQKIRENLEPIFIEVFSEFNSQYGHLEGLQELTSWYEKAKKEDNIQEKILEDIINETMKFLPTQYANLCVENIKLNSQKKTKKCKI